MKRRKKVIIIAVILIIVAVIICGFIMNYFNGKNNKANIVLSTSAGINFKWECKMVDKDIATVDNVYKKYMDPEEDGGEIQIRYLIKGIKKGKTKFVCNYMDNEAGYAVETNIYEIIVDKDLNVEIINN